MKNVVGLFVSIIYIAGIFITAKVLDKSGKEIQRKYMHIMLSNWWVIAMIFFENVIWASILPACFIVVNYISLKKDLIKVMEREEGDENKGSYGTVFYAISLLVLVIYTFGMVKNPLAGLCGVWVMGYGDGLAAICGQSIKSKTFKIRGNTKSIAGCSAMFVATLTIFLGYFVYTCASHVFIKSFLIAVLMTVIEAISIKGTDNLTVPILSSILAVLLV